MKEHPLMERPLMEHPLIDRKSLVRRHTVRLTEPDPAHVLTVGNGDFAYSCDITGMQSFPAYHDQGAAMAERRLAVHTATMSAWGWHAMPNPEGHTLPDAMSEHNTARGTVSYPDRFGIAAMMGGDLPEEMRPGAWLSANPQRLDLGRIGLLLRPAPDAEPETGPEALRDTEQCLDLWTGTVSSRFTYAGHETAVTTVADPHRARVAFRIESELLADGLAGIVIRFPYASDGFFQTSDWTSPERHRTDLDQVTDTGCVLRRTLDGTTYTVRLTWPAGVVRPTANPHEYLLTTGSDTLELVASFSPDGEVPSVEGDFTALAAASAAWWEDFWTSGAAIDLTGSTDPRAAELERRVVLSQYLTAVNCSGTLPPQETGLITNSWHGKHHLEMHWWHAAHFAAWGRPELLERSLDWYLSILPEARATARRQRYEGARWPKQTGPDGRESPSDIGVFLLWQQPHPPLPPRTAAPRPPRERPGAAFRRTRRGHRRVHGLLRRGARRHLPPAGAAGPRPGVLRRGDHRGPDLRTRLLVVGAGDRPALARARRTRAGQAVAARPGRTGPAPSA
ncbi:hypothetical protein AB0E08_14180 [Streptomyces sp. NPDC048281]|uniref:hypothetical protein n=1 Tax=Streptomyces sp. NPDC048281 TaxID=3154715 RepID=UPI003420D700